LVAMGLMMERTLFRLLKKVEDIYAKFYTTF